MTSEPRRLHPAAVGVEALSALRGMAIPLFVVAVLGSGGSVGGVLAYGGIGLVVSAFVAWLTWETTRWWLQADEVRLKTGIVSEKIVSIPLERVQAIDTVHGPVQRLFGVAELHVQSAGGGKHGEIVLKAVAAEQAEELREAVRRAGAEADGSVVSAAREAAARPEAPAPLPGSGGPQATWRLGRGALLAAALTSGSFGVLLPVLAGASQVLDDVIGFDDAERLVPHSIGAVVLIAGVALAVAWILSIGGTLIAFAGFTVAREGDRLRIQRGFLERRVASVPVTRVHAVRVVESLLRQPFGLATVRIETAGYADEAATAQTLLPLVRRSEADALVAQLLPELAPEPPATPLTPPPSRALRRYVTRPATVALLVGAGVGIAFAPLGLLALALLLPAVAFGVSDYRAAGWARSGDLVVLRWRGLLGRTTATADARRLQRVSTAASPFQRRAALTTLRVAVSSGAKFGVWHLDARTADDLRAWLAATATAGSPASRR